jgi:hypothetical protein
LYADGLDPVPPLHFGFDDPGIVADAEMKEARRQIRYLKPLSWHEAVNRRGVPTPIGIITY